MFSTPLRKFLLLGVGGSATFVGYKASQNDGHFDVYNVGAARFGRAAFTVSSKAF